MCSSDLIFRQKKEKEEKEKKAKEKEREKESLRTEAGEGSFPLAEEVKNGEQSGSVRLFFAESLFCKDVGRECKRLLLYFFACIGIK